MIWQVQTLQFLQDNVMVGISARDHPLLLAVSLLPPQPYIRVKQVPTAYAHHIRRSGRKALQLKTQPWWLSIPVAV